MSLQSITSNAVSTLSQLYKKYPRGGKLVILLITLFLVSALYTPDPTSSSFQFPGLLPSHYPPSRHPSNALLDMRLSKAGEQLSLTCPKSNEPIYVDPGLSKAQEQRYEHLRKGKGRIMVVSAVKDIEGQLPDFLNSLIVLITYLGPERLSFSIVEGPSGDCTAQALELVVGPTLLSLGVPQNHLHLVTRVSKINFSKHNRIELLANLRNKALSPLWSNSTMVKGKRRDVTEAVVFINDVYLKASDVLEVLHQHKKSGAGISTAFDWMERKPAHYYDVWVGRTVS